MLTLDQVSQNQKADAEKITRRMFEENRTTWLKTFDQNWPSIKNSKKLPKAFLLREDPVLVMGAGPAVDRLNLWPLLKIHRKNFFLVVVDMALKPCLFHRITPNLVVTTDNHPMIAPAMKIKKKIPAFFAVSSFPGAVQAWKGPRHFFFPENLQHCFPPETCAQVKHIPWVFCLGNVGGTALVLTEMVLGAKRIGLIGMDYACIKTAHKNKNYFQRYQERTFHREGTPYAHIPIYYSTPPGTQRSDPFEMAGFTWITDGMFQTYAQYTGIYLSRFTKEVAEIKKWIPSKVYTLTPGLLDGLVGVTRLKKSTVENFLGIK